MATVELKVPDIGDFKDVEIIEVLVKPGDSISVEQSLITVESDKASMEIPASIAGKIVEMKVKLGDKVSEGSVLALIEAAAGAGASVSGPAAESGRGELKEGSSRDPNPQGQANPSSGGAGSQSNPSSGGAANPQGTPSSAANAIKHFTGTPDISCDMAVLGAGPGGYSAAFRAADLGMNTVLIERFSTLGGVCLNVGCIPSKALLHVAAVMDEVKHMGALGVSFGEPAVDLDKLRDQKSKVIGKLTGGLAGMAKARKVQVVQGVGKFIDSFHIEVTAADGGKKVIGFKNAIIAAGSEAVKLPFMPQDERVVTSTGALELKFKPKRMLVIGGGIIGLEMATVYSTLGARIDVVEMLDGLMQGADRDLVKVWQKHNAHRFDKLMLKCKTVGAEAKADGIHVKFEGEGAPAEPQVYDLVLQAVGRRPNGASIAAEQAGVTVSDRGFIAVDAQMRTNQPHIFAIGDIVGNPMLAHKAVHEGHVAAEAAAGQKSFFDARVIPSVAYTDPEMAWVGVTEDEAKAKGMQIEKAVFPWAASGRAIANGRDEGFTKIIVDPESHRVIGGAIVGTHAGDMIGEFALAIEMGADPHDIGKTIHPHPTLGESIGMVAEVFSGSCTDLPPQKKK
ncbi:MAG: dihydrolipoyl dehydrogenase [Betaproteobacteria bacterium]|nr:dihydrolipoyl dehydrogenase [Betaproteobacteria bacterium]